MSMTEQIRICAMDMLEKTGRCNVKQVFRELDKRGIQLDPKTTMVRTTLLRMLQTDPAHIEKIGRGEYRYIRKTVVDDTNMTGVMNIEEDAAREIVGVKEENAVVAEKNDTDDRIDAMIEINDSILDIADGLRTFRTFQASVEEFQKVRTLGVLVKKHYEFLKSLVEELNL